MFDNRLKYCRQSLDMTLEELGLVFGVTKQTISNWENCNDVIPLAKLIRFCNIYGYSVDYIMGLSNKNIKYDKTNLNKMILARNLKLFRKKAGKTQSDISSECVVSQSTYSKYESGRNIITTTTLYTICKNYNLSMDYMLGRKKK